jgi:hypothetical protein
MHADHPLFRSSIEYTFNLAVRPLVIHELGY